MPCIAIAAWPAAIVERGGDYVLAVKDNQPALLRDAKAAITAGVRKGLKPTTTRDAKHGRQEKARRTGRAGRGYGPRPRLQRPEGRGPDHRKRAWTRPSSGYFLMSRCYSRQEVLRIVREHWTIENSLHWPLDVVLDEDLARNRKDNAPAILRFSNASLSTSSEPSRHQNFLAGQTQTRRLNDDSSLKPSVTCDSPAIGRPPPKCTRRR